MIVIRYVKMSSIYVSSIVISVIYLLVRFIEMRFVNKDVIPLKLLARDTLFVFFSVIAGYFVADQIGPLLEDGATILKESPAVFVGNPEF